MSKWDFAKNHAILLQQCSLASVVIILRYERVGKVLIVCHFICQTIVLFLCYSDPLIDGTKNWATKRDMSQPLEPLENHRNVISLFVTYLLFLNGLLAFFAFHFQSLDLLLRRYALL